MNSVEKLRRIIRAISQFHENEGLIRWLERQWPVIFLTSKRRRALLFLGALFVGFKAVQQRYLRSEGHAAVEPWLVTSLTFAILLALVYLLYLAATHFQKLPRATKKYPQIALHLLFWGILALVWMTPEDGGIARNILVLVAISLPFLLWRCGYMLMSGQRNKAQNSKFSEHLFYLWPVWGGTFTPIGKGADYLSRCEAKTPQAYARSVLAALKLFMLMGLLDLFRQILAALLYGEPRNSFTPLFGGYNLGIPRLKEIAAGQKTASLVTSWIAVYLELIWETLRHAIPGHKWVALLRLCGFNVFRNTYKPLLAESILEFWNRYYYYFKELLLEFFFFPTYLRYFRNRPNLRIFAAIFAAAFVGNMYYHFLQARGSLAEGQVLEAAESLSPRLVYCFFLALGIYVSTLRQQQQRGQSNPAGSTRSKLIKLRHIAGVWTFFALLNLWNPRAINSMAQRVGYCFSLLGF